jgi:hypothetical protein
MQPGAPSNKPGRRLAEGQELSAEIPIFMDGEYNLRVSIERPKDRNVQVAVKVDGGKAAGRGDLGDSEFGSLGSLLKNDFGPQINADERG